MKHLYMQRGLALKTSARQYAKLITTGKAVIVKLTGNLNFLVPAVSIANLQLAVDSADAAYAKWMTGTSRTKVDLLDLRQKCLVLKQLLLAEMDYCTTTAIISAGQDEAVFLAILGTTGYEMANVKTPPVTLE